MRRAKVIDFRRPSGGFGISRVISFLFRLILSLVRYVVPFLPLAILVGLFLLPKTPHLRMVYTYVGTETNRFYTNCHYLGIHGFVQTVLPEGCPIVAFIEERP